MAKKKWRPKRRPQIPTPEQDMFIRKGGYNPYDWLLIYESEEKIRIINKETRETVILEK